MLRWYAAILTMTFRIDLEGDDDDCLQEMFPRL